MQDLGRQRQAVMALAWFGAIFFLGWIGFNVAQAVHHGYGLVHGRVVVGAVGDQGGNGWFVDSLLLVGAGVACALLIAAWGWLGPRLRIGSESVLTGAEADAQPFYLIDIPRITRGLIAVGIACTVGVAVCGAILFPVILIKYGW
jgi:hypothetical protein